MLLAQLPIYGVFLLYSPLNQGLKLPKKENCKKKHSVFTLQSIKSRIETLYRSCQKATAKGFLLYSPLNQGLKPSRSVQIDVDCFCFYSTVH